MDDARPHAKVRLPSVDKVLRSERGLIAVARFGRQATTNAIREILEDCRVRMKDSEPVSPDANAVAAEAHDILSAQDAPTLRRVFNLTGTVLHTNLGRAALPESAIEAAVAAMRYPANIEYDIETGRRGERDDHVRSLIREITGAEDCCIVNNNAAAVLLVLNEFGKGREAIVSRGELIEIGGAFRLPDIMARAGAKLVEVGTTNRTHLRDYEAAINDATGLVMKVHTSNYLIQGFTTTVPASELATLANTRGVPFVDDLGSGTLIDLARYGLRPEPTVQQALAAGADLVTFSGDKLLGGPQIGVVAGRKDLIAKIAKNPLKRALRIDKIRMAALAETLKLYRDPDKLSQKLPTLRAFVRTRSELRAVAERMLPVASAAFGPALRIACIECGSQIGSGALPLETLDSAALMFTPAEKNVSGAMIERLAAAFRAAPVPVIGRIHDGALILDMRCLDDEATFAAQLEMVATAFRRKTAP